MAFMYFNMLSRPMPTSRTSNTQYLKWEKKEREMESERRDESKQQKRRSIQGLDEAKGESGWWW